MKFRYYHKDLPRRLFFQKHEKVKNMFRFVRSSSLIAPSIDLATPSLLDHNFDTFLLRKKAVDAIAEFPRRIVGVSRSELSAANNLIVFLHPFMRRGRISNLCNSSYRANCVSRYFKYNRHSFKRLIVGQYQRKGMNNFSIFPGLKRKI